MLGNLFDKFHFEQLFKNQVIIEKKNSISLNYVIKS